MKTIIVSGIIIREILATHILIARRPQARLPHHYLVRGVERNAPSLFKESQI